jgi:hypothetical protein
MEASSTSLPILMTFAAAVLADGELVSADVVASGFELVQPTSKIMAKNIARVIFTFFKTVPPPINIIKKLKSL